VLIDCFFFHNRLDFVENIFLYGGISLEQVDYSLHTCCDRVRVTAKGHRMRTSNAHLYPTEVFVILGTEGAWLFVFHCRN
jgi:hypothetical protein